MPFRLNEYRAKVQFTTGAAMPYRIYEACLATNTPSNVAYINRAICEALSRDLDIPLEELLATLPPTRGPSAHLFNPADNTMNRFHHRRIGPGNTVEEVK